MEQKIHCDSSQPHEILDFPFCSPFCPSSLAITPDHLSLIYHQQTLAHYIQKLNTPIKHDEFDILS